MHLGRSPHLDLEHLHRLSQKVVEQRDRIARQREVIEASRRALWERIDRLRDSAQAAAEAGRGWMDVPPLATDAEAIGAIAAMLATGPRDGGGVFAPPRLAPGAETGGPQR
jgi:hypothetical protein